MFTHLAGETLDEKIVTRMTRLVNVWKERAIFDRKVQEEVAKVWASRGKERGGSNGPPAKKAKVEKPTRELEEKEDAEEEEDVVSGLALVRRMATERERQGEGEEGSLARLEEEVRERRRLGEALADLVRRQQEELQQVGGHQDFIDTFQIGFLSFVGKWFQLTILHRRRSSWFE